MTATAEAAACLLAPPRELRVVGDGRRTRNKVVAAQRRARAIQLLASGLTYQQVADELGYKNRGTVHKLVQSALQAEQADSVDFLRQVEVSRLDALQASLWDKAESGDLEAVEQCVRIIEARCRVLGLLAPARRKRGRCRQPQTVVLLEDDCRLRACPSHT